MKKITVLLAASVLLFTASCTNNQPSKPKTPDELLKMASESSNINTGKDNYTFSIPKGWTTKDTVMQGVKFHFIFPPADGNTSGVNINILNEDMRGFALEEYTQKNIKSMTTMLPEFKLKGQGDFMASGIKSSWIHYTMKQNGTDYEAILYVIPHNGIAYLMTAAMYEGRMNEYKDTFDRIAQSFKFKD